ncbi:MAG: M15 family metallopeptidase [Elainellaceae cyanobacterium]
MSQVQILSSRLNADNVLRTLDKTSLDEIFGNAISRAARSTESTSENTIRGAIAPAKPHYAIPIHDCGEPLVPIPLDQFAVQSPHPYVQRGAPYGHRSPYHLRQGVLDRLMAVQNALQHAQPGWRLCLFDAYRPVAVQRFMVEATFLEQLEASGLSPDALTPQQEQQLWEQVYQFWAPPSENVATPPPHSTGAAVDLTLVDQAGQPVDMGSPIDEISPRSYPNYFAPSDTIADADRDRSKEAIFHHHRQQLNTVMEAAGFRRHQQEWWHFSYGDQMWAWLMHKAQPTAGATALYGGL